MEHRLSVAGAELGREEAPRGALVCVLTCATHWHRPPHAHTRVCGVREPEQGGMHRHASQRCHRAAVRAEQARTGSPRRPDSCTWGSSVREVTRSGGARAQWSLRTTAANPEHGRRGGCRRRRLPNEPCTAACRRRVTLLPGDTHVARLCWWRAGRSTCTSAGSRGADRWLPRDPVPGMRVPPSELAPPLHCQRSGCHLSGCCLHGVTLAWGPPGAHTHVRTRSHTHTHAPVSAGEPRSLLERKVPRGAPSTDALCPPQPRRLLRRL